MIFNKKRKAFSMIEMLFTMSVIAIISSIAISQSYLLSSAKAKDINGNIQKNSLILTDIKTSIITYGKPSNVTDNSISFKNEAILGKNCTLSYKFNKKDKYIIKETKNCEDTVKSMPLYLSDIEDAKFKKEDNDIYKLTITPVTESNVTYPIIYSYSFFPYIEN